MDCTPAEWTPRFTNNNCTLFNNTQYTFNSTSGKINITFDEPEESHLNWRQHSKIFDIWLLKK